ncbi:hypothetical protein SRS16CHR_03515 [Variovorax sp. SRS16]|uniref:hypothetical protein n=1 Tax=Variovorax sp. SRS16 TaxID=282217 RepID=UPI0013174CAF|nr:hypothetical protein [Variovorax sp. SRS16]VTU24744.1 hypothetical protein SRS16CHR_03515 [Variovorax sp. SRS16]
MSNAGTTPEPQAAVPSPDVRRRAPLPAGYREGVITAITVMIGFSLSFVRYWAFEAPGDWTANSVIALIVLVIPIVVQIYTLYRALLVADDDETTYRSTIRWFIGSICGMLVSVALAAIVLSGRN